MKKVLVACLYPSDNCPLFSYSYAKGLINCGYDVYAVLPDNVENLENWKRLIGDDHLALVYNKRGEGGVVNNVKKVLNVVNLELRYHKYLGNIIDIKFEMVFYMFFHRWNYLIKQHVNSKMHIMFVHDPIQHSGEPEKRAKMHYDQVITMDRVIVMSKAFIPILKNEYGFTEDKIYHIPICIIDHSDSEQSNRKCIYDITKPVHFVFFGRITKYKGIDVLLKAYNRIVYKNSEVSLTIAGAGDISPYMDLLKQSRNVEIVNRYILDDEVDDFFVKENTIVVLPYVDATQSGVVVLAYAHSNPIIYSKLDGLVEQMDDGRLGLSFEAGNDEELSQCMQHCIDYPELLLEQSDKMGAKAAKLNWNVLVSDLMKEIK